MSEKRFFGLAGSRDRELVVTATKRYLSANSEVKEAIVACEELEGEFARVNAHDPKGEAPPIFGFLKKAKDGAWSVIALGSFFDAAFFRQHGIPAALQTR